MKILALLKYSRDVAEIKVNPETSELQLSNVPQKIGDIDKNVVEAAVQLVEKYDGTVEALTLGPEAAQDGFRDVLAMGVSEVFLLQDSYGGDADAAMVVGILEAAIRKNGPYDLIMCGFASDDGYTFQVPPRLAERLDLPLVSFVRSISLVENEIQATRALDDTDQVVSVPLPAVISIDEEAFPPRRTTLMDAMKAKQKPVHVWDLAADLGLAETELTALRIGEQTEQVGIVVHRKEQLLAGEGMEDLADRLIDVLIEEEILKEGAS